jgi:hypothetical protein
MFPLAAAAAGTPVRLAEIRAAGGKYPELLIDYTS